MNPLENYTKEDLESLCKFIKEKINSSDYSVDNFSLKDFCNALKNCCFNSYQLFNYPFQVNPNFRVFFEPLDEMPLMINDNDFLTSLISIWRLKIGK